MGLHRGIPDIQVASDLSVYYGRIWALAFGIGIAAMWHASQRGYRASALRSYIRICSK